MHDQTKQSGIIAWFASNSVAANLLMIMILLCGIASSFNIRKAIMPDFEANMIQIRVPHLGATPAEVEEAVVLRIEEAVQDVKGIKTIRSTAFEGMGQVQLEIENGFDVNEALDEIKVRVDAISTFPAETERPIVEKVVFENDVLWISVYGDMSERARKELATEVRNELMALPDVSSVQLLGARDYEIAIELSEQTLREYGLTLSEAAAAVRASSLDMPGGSIKTDKGDIALRTKGQAYSGSEFADIVLRTNFDGTRLMLGDIAHISDGFAEGEGFSRFNGLPATPLRVRASGDQNVLKIDAAVARYIEDKRKRLPEGAALEQWGNSAYYLKDRLRMMYVNMAEGALLVFLVLTLFLRLRIAMWVIVGIPISFLGALWLMPLGPYAQHVNVLSLFGFILVLGIVVDDAIIIGESIYTEISEHGQTLDNVIIGARRVAVPATFGVLTTIAAFAPMLLVGGQVGPFFEAIAVIVCLCLFFSLVESKLILPAHLAHTPLHLGDRTRRNPVRRIQDFFSDGLHRFIHQTYRPLLELSLRHRATTIASFMAVMLLTVGLVAGNWIKFEFFPNVPSDFIQASLTMNDGTPPSVRNEALTRMEKAVQTMDEAYQAESGDPPVVTATVVFTSGDAGGVILLELTKAQERSIDAFEIERRWREAVGEIPGTKELSYSSVTNTGGGASINLQFSGSDFDQLEAAALEVQNYLAGYDGVYDINNTYSRGNQEIKLRIKPEAEVLGLSMMDLGRQVRQAFYGEEAQRIQRGRDELRVMVRYPRDERHSVSDLENMRIRTADGTEVPLLDVAEVDIGTGFSSIRRVDRKRTVSITADTDTDKIRSNELIESVEAELIPELLARYPGVRYGREGASVEQQELIRRIAMFFGVAMFLIYGLLAIPLRSYLQPLIIMVVIPFGFVGAVLGHLLFGQMLSMMSVFGLVALAGVVINDSLILLDFINQARAEGLSLNDAIVQAGLQRFRAILLTTVTTFLGLMPIMFESSLQAQFLVPMAISLGFGILFGTGITLLLVPALYSVVGRFATGASFSNEPMQKPVAT
ncbi:MAG: efflux RND transporter permease subunit [Gammaproteobacteria bacterium]|nr:efflux RND transporter permease subunit [Gammaproteobacteria bacterium]